MKKILYFAVGMLAIVGFGMNIGLAHAQSVPGAGTPSTATLQQELQVAKATLVNLEMQAGMIPAGDNNVPATGSASAGLSVSDRTTISNALGSLVSALSSLNATLAANPTEATTHQAAIASVLSGMQSTLVAMNNTLTNGNQISGGGAASAPIAVNAPSTGNSGSAAASTGSNSGSNAPAPIAQTQPSTPAMPSTGSLAPTAAPTAGSNNTPQTAQASNAWTFVVAHWPTITIIILVALILLILFWPSSDEKKNDHHGAPASRPQTPNRPIVTTTVQSSRTETQTATPVSTVVAAPAQKVEAQQSKVTVIRPQQNPPKQIA